MVRISHKEFLQTKKKIAIKEARLRVCKESIKGLRVERMTLNL
jgi:hypothetical protein